MQIKSKLRKEAREKRKQILNREISDELIAEKLLSLDEYKDAKTILIYASLDEEIKTDDIISRAHSDDKRVAVPYCYDESGNMGFYLISSVDELETGSFNVREPDKNQCEKLENFSDSIIIVPGMMFDKSGFRLGYGKGYYDRFLAKYNQISIGLCYDEMLVSSLPRGKFDKNVDIIITQSEIIRCNNGGKNG